jgi:hypothetical protein
MAEGTDKPDIRLNLVRFAVDDGDGPTLSVKLEGEFVWTPGMKTTLNRVLVRYEEFDLLEGDLDREGTLQFWSRRDPDDPDDVELGPDAYYKRLSIVDCEPAEIGVAAGESERRILEYRLFLADRRNWLGVPRGGFLVAGDINTTPFNPTLPVDKNGLALKTHSDLLALCAEAMGISVSIPTSVNNALWIKDLQWRGSHAPTEMGKLLDSCGHVLVLWFDGTYHIRQIGEEDLELPSPDDDVPDLVVPKVERLGKTVVFCSMPTAATNTYTAVGIGSNWEFVARDKADVNGKLGPWKSTYSLDALNGKTPAETVRGNFENVGIADRARLRNELYRCVRLKTTSTFKPLMRQVAETQGTTGQAWLRSISVQAKMATQGSDGKWSNKDFFVGLQPLAILEGNIIVVAERIGNVNAATGGGYYPDAAFQEINFEDFRVRLTQEVEVDGAPFYYLSAFTAAVGGGVEQLALAEAEFAFTHAEETKSIVVPVPDMQLYLLDGEEQNREDLDNQCAALAERYLAGSGNEWEIRTVRGYVRGNLSGRVSEVRISQEELSTSFRVDTWFLPRSTYLVEKKEREGGAGGAGAGGGGGAYEGQAAVAAARTAMGVSGNVQPSVPLVPAAAAAVVQAPPYIDLTGKEAGGGYYIAELVNLTFKANPAANLSLASAMTNSGVAVLAVNTLEDDRNTHRVPIGSRLPCILTPVPHADGRPIVLFAYDPDAIRAERYAVGSGGTNYSHLDVRRTVVAIDPKTDWEKVVEFKPCPPPP